MFPRHHCHLRVVVFGASLQISVSHFFTFSFFAGAISSASMLFWVKFICPAGDSSSRALVVMLIGAFIVFCSPDESPPTHIHSSTNTFFKVSPFGIQFTHNRPSETLFLFPGSLKCWCGTIATMFLPSWTRQSRPLPFFPRGCTFSMVKTIACCPCH